MWAFDFCAGLPDPMKAIEEAKERGRDMIDREAKVPITASAVELFQRALAIKAGGNTRRRKFLDLQLALHRELNLQPSPLDLEADQPPPPWMTGRVPDSVLELCRRHSTPP